MHAMASAITFTQVLWVYTCQILALLFVDNPYVLWSVPMLIWPALGIGYNVHRCVEERPPDRHMVLQEEAV